MVISGRTYVRHPFDGYILGRLHFVVILLVDPEEKTLSFTSRLGHLPHDIEGFLV